MYEDKRAYYSTAAERRAAEASVPQPLELPPPPAA
jgi:hypothetical protein